MSWPQAQQAAMDLGVPALAKVFYYGKEFGSKKQKLTKEGTVAADTYKPLSVTRPGAEPEQLLEEVAAKEETKENPAEAYLQQLLAQAESPTSGDDLLDILKRG